MLRLPLIVVGLVTALLFLFAGHWLAVAEKAYALAGAILLALPYFRDSRMREIWSVLSETKAGTGGADEVIQEAKEAADVELKSFRPIDYRDSILGLALLGLSFAIGTFVEAAKLLGAGTH